MTLPVCSFVMCHAPDVGCCPIVLMLPARKAVMSGSAAAVVTCVPASLVLPTDTKHTVQACMCPWCTRCVAYRCCVVCRMEWGTYLFFAFWAAVMTLYVIFFLPETKGVPLEEMQVLWARHWFWGNFVRNKVCYRCRCRLCVCLLHVCLGYFVSTSCHATIADSAWFCSSSSSSSSSSS